MNYLAAVREFHEAFGHPVKDTPDISDRELNDLRFNLLNEELIELRHAMLTGDKVEALDALCDLQYVLSGAVLALGFTNVFDDAFAEVQRSNMSKLDANGKPVLRHDGKVLKGPAYSPPQLERFV